MSKRIAILAGLLLLLGLPASAWAQSTTITGTVTSSEDGQPLPGASVVLEGTQSGAATDVDGAYELTVPEAEGTLIFSYVGFQTQEVPIDGRTTIDVELSPDLQALDELVVVGYGTQRERELTGSIAQVSAEEIENVPVNSFEEALQGRVAGVTITRGSGKLGQGIQVRVRGSASVTADSEPLYVIDGLPVTTANLSNTGAALNPLAQINPDDIASIQVLKDASAAAIYGARASNGVVIITTKSGMAGATEFSVGVQRSWSGPTNKVDFLDAEEYVNFFTEAARNRGEIEWESAPAEYESRQDAIDTWVGQVNSAFDFYAQGTDWRDLDVNSDWQDRAFNDNAGGLNVDLSARGGSEQTQFYVSGSYDVQDGILIRDTYDRITGLLNVDHQLSDRFELGGKLSVARTLNNRVPYDNSFATPMQLVAQLPISPVYVPDASVGMEDGYLSEYVPTDELNQNTYYLNNLIYTDNARFQMTTFRSIGTAYLQADLLPGLSFRSQFGLDLLDQNEDTYYNSVIEEATNGYGFNAWDRVVNYNFSNYVTYAGALAEAHSVEATAGVDYQSVTQDGSSVEGEQFPNDDFTQIASAAEITGGSSYETGYRFLSFFARANYEIAERYLFKLSGRYDGSSRFGRDNQYGFFPAASAGWILSDEAFLEDTDWMSFLKLRASYGLTGNAGIGNFASLGLWGGSPYGGRAGIYPDQIANPSLRWERTAQLDLGLDFGFFNDRVSGTVDYYVKSTDDLLLNVNLPSSTGFFTQTRNVGELKNRGVEFLLNTRNVVGAFSWSSSFNLGVNRNEITDLNDQVITGGAANRAIEGEPIGVFFGYEYAGVDAETGDALYYVNATDAEGNVVDPDATTNNPNAANRVVIGSPHADFTGGLGNQFSYKGFDLDVFFQFSYGGQIYDGGGLYKTSNGWFLDNQLATQLDAWQEPGDVTDVPEARYGISNGTADSDRYLYDGSYLRLKNVTLAYTVPQRLIESFQLSNVRIYLTGINLLTFTDYPWWDPEVNSDYLGGNIGLGNEFYTAPQARTISGGLQFSF